MMVLKLSLLMMATMPLSARLGVRLGATLAYLLMKLQASGSGCSLPKWVCPYQQKGMGSDCPKEHGTIKGYRLLTA